MKTKSTCLVVVFFVAWAARGCGSGGNDCTPNARTICKEGATYWVDSCGNQGDKAGDCDCGCNAESTECKEQCDCVPDCTGKECGSDGCDGTCPPGCGDNETCNSSGFCECRDEPCADNCCSAGEVCYNDVCCVPACDGRECGSDGCGGSCGVIETCDDGDICNGIEMCVNGVCIPGKPLLCQDDDNPCTNDTSCKPILGCNWPDDSLTCDDVDVCNGIETCTSGVCWPGTPLNCTADGLPCTNDSCDPTRGCNWPDDSLSCNDDDLCNGDETCSGGVCSPGSPLVCSADGLPCTNDICHPTYGCNWNDDTLTCSDGDPCYDPDYCSSGVCVPGPDVSECGDGIFCPDTEICDDDNGINGDGCNNDCILSGTTLWTQIHPGGDSDYYGGGYGIATDATGNVVVTGHLTDSDTFGDVWLRKYDPDGNVLWTKTYDSTYGNSYGYAVATDALENILVTGYEASPPFGTARIWLRKYDPAGNILWTETYESAVLGQPLA